MGDALFYVPTDLTIFADGGTIAGSPSVIGGTWAFRVVDYGGSVIHEQSGAFRPADVGLQSIGCTTSEVLAIVEGAEWVRACYPHTPSLTIASDSARALWLSAMDGVNGMSIVSKAIIKRLAKVRRWLRTISETADVMIDPHPFRPGSSVELRFVQMKGHPTSREWHAKSANGRPASPHNVWCDKAATAAGKEIHA